MTDAEEVFDIVNQDDQVIGQMTRSQVHQRNLLHRSVHALVFDNQGRIFLQLRAPDRDCDPGLWDSSVGGHLQAGETYEEAVLRETEEELGIKLDAVPEKLFKLAASAETAFEFCEIYRVFHNGPFVIDFSEATEGRWFEPDELNSWIASKPELLSSSFRKIWNTYLEE